MSDRREQPVNENSGASSGQFDGTAPMPEMNVFDGVRWSAVGTWGGQLIQLLVTVVLARILVPEDYGLLAMAVVFTGFLAIFKTMGFDKVVIQQESISDALLHSLFWLNVVVSALLAVLTVAIAPLCAWFFQEPRITAILMVLSVNFLLSTPAIVPKALFARELRFKVISIIQLIAQLVGGLVAICLALLDWGVWALVSMHLSTSVLLSLLFHIVSPWHPKLIFATVEVKRILAFGTNVTGASFFHYWARRADNLIIGAALGAVPLGYYSLAYTLMMRPLTAITFVISRVLFPVFSRKQDNDSWLARSYCRACSAISLITFPMMFGLVVLAEPFVQVVLGDKWLPVIPLIWWLAPVAAVQSLWALSSQILLAKGRSGWLLGASMISGLTMITAFVIGVNWGVNGVAAAYAIVCFAWTPVSLWLAKHHISELSWSDIAAALLPSVVMTAIMAILVATICFVLTRTQIDPAAVLVAGVLSGILAYVATGLFVYRHVFADVIRLLPPSLVKNFSNRAAN